MARRSLLSFSSALVASLVALGAAEAQEPVRGTFALDRYEPPPIGDRFFAVPDGGVDGHLAIRAGLVLDYANRPLVLRDTCDDPSDTDCNHEGSELGAIVANQLVAHVGASASFWDLASIAVDVPLVLVNQGDDAANPRVPTAILEAPSGAGIGDLRFALRVQLLGEPNGPAELGLGTYLWVPVGDPSEYTGDDGVRVRPYAAVNGTVGAFVYAGQIGMTLREPAELVNVAQGTDLEAGLGVAALVWEKRLQIGPELYASTVVGNDVSAFRGRTTNVELLGGAKFRAGPWVFGAAAGPGLTHGVGTPALRALATAAYSPVGVRDSDGDGIADPDDACPNVPGRPSADPTKNGCPPDRDGDGIVDDRDACPDEAGLPAADPKKNGCPILTDGDRDGIPDKTDACPDVPGVKDANPKKNGCPADRDDDGVPDATDACPEVSGIANEDPKKNGCPADRDGDGVPDAKDACPDIPGVASEKPEDNGCPGDRDG